jgi:hypothetical protein
MRTLLHNCDNSTNRTTEPRSFNRPGAEVSSWTRRTTPGACGHRWPWGREIGSGRKIKKRRVCTEQATINREWERSDRQTDIHTDRQTHRQTDTQIERIPINLKELKVLQFLLQCHADLLEVLLSSLHGLVRLQCGRFKSMQLQGCYENGKKKKKRSSKHSQWQ